MIRRPLFALALCLALALPAAAAEPQLTVGIHYWTDVTPGQAQSYNIRIAGAAHGVYIILALHPDTEIYAVNSAGGLQCAEIAGEGLTVFCYMDHLAGAAIVGAHGSIRGPGDNGVYGILRVGTLKEGSPGRGWLLSANYREGGTIPAALTPESEPGRHVYLPIVRSK